MQGYKVINKFDVSEISSSHIKCDGTINATIYFKDGTALDVYGLTLKQAENLEQLNFESIKLDVRFLEQTEKQWLRQNGIGG